VRGFSCYDDLRQEWCSVKFDCLYGGCFVSQVDKDIRTYVFPVVWAFVIVLISSYVIYVLYGKLSDEDVAVYVEAVIRFLAILQFITAFFLLFGPTAYQGLFFLACACFYFHSRAHINNDLIIVISLSLFSMSLLGGQNVFSFSEGISQSETFNYLAESYYNNTCFLMYGVSIGDSRCGMFLMFEMFATFLLLIIQVPIFLFTGYLMRFPIKDGGSTILYSFYAYFGKYVVEAVPTTSDDVDVPLDKILGYNEDDEEYADLEDDDQVDYVKMEGQKEKAKSKKPSGGRGKPKQEKKRKFKVTGKEDTYEKM